MKEGLHTHMFNLEEERFAAWWKMHGNGIVAATIFQWLGSPVGSGMLSDLGYIKNQDLERDEDAGGGTPAPKPAVVSPFWWVVKQRDLYLVSSCSCGPRPPEHIRRWVDVQGEALVITSRARARTLATACGPSARVVRVRARSR